MLSILCAAAALAAAQPAPPAPAAVVAQPLLEQTLARLPFTGTDAERARFSAIAARLLEAPTGRELAGVFVSRDARVGASFDDFPGTAVYEREPGVVTFAANEAAHALRTEASAAVALNRACATVDGAAVLDLCAAQLSHELFGHVLGWVEASPAVRRVYWLYDDELLARLVAWNVTLELTGRVREPEAFCAAEDPAAAQARLPAVYPSCVWGLTRPELRDAEASLRAHRALARDDRQRQAVDDELSWLSSDAARPAAARAAASDPLFDRLQERMDALRARLLASESVLKVEAACGLYR